MKSIIVLILLVFSTAVFSLGVTSNAFEEGQMIPVKYTCDGENINPQIDWQEKNSKVKSFALVVLDPDAKSAPHHRWIHWLIANIPADFNRFPANINHYPHPIMVGLNSWKKPSYSGPCPPKGDNAHRYIFTIYALSHNLKLKPNFSYEAFEKSLENNQINNMQLIGYFKR